jgi:hypothetical protein
MRNVEPRPLVHFIALGSLGVVVIGSALAVGTVHYETLLCVSGFAIASTVALLLLARGHVSKLPAPAILLIGLAAWSAFQAMALPLGALSKVDPQSAEIWARVLRPFGESPPNQGSISLDPGASLVEALKWFVYALIFIIAHLVSSRQSRIAAFAIPFISAVTVAMVALSHGLVGATSLFGIYTPELAVPRWGVPPILNPNNLSGYLNLGAFCGLGILLARRNSDDPPPVLRRGLVVAGLAVVVAVSVLAASRAGVLGLGLGVIFFAALVWVAGSDDRERAEVRGESSGAARAFMPPLVAVSGGIVLAVVGASTATWAELWDSNAEKLRIAAWSIPLIKDFPLFGVGRGAFSTIFPAYRPASGNTLYVYPENFIVQWISEWGIPVAMATILLLIWLFRPTRNDERRANSLRIGAWVGLGVLLLQNLVDLALEVPAVAILSSAVLGSLYAGGPEADRRPEVEESSPARRKQRRTFRVRMRRRALAYAVLAGGAVLFTLAAAFGRHQVEDERTEIQRDYNRLHVDDPTAVAMFRGHLHAAMLRHPGEPYFPLMGAIVEHRVKGGSPMPWIAAALERDPMNGRAHIVLSEILATRGAIKQALMELRLAVECEPNLLWVVGQNATRLARDVESLERAVPDGTKGAPVLAALAAFAQGDNMHEVRMSLLEHALARDPNSVDALSARAREVLSVVAANRTPCESSERLACLSQVRQDADTIHAIAPTSCQPLILRALALDLEEKADEGEAALATGCSACRELEACCVERVRLAAKKKAPESLSAAVRAYLAVGCSRESPCVHPQIFVADLFAGRGDWTSAAEHYRMAAVASDKAEDWLKAASAASRAGNPVLAGQALSKAQRRGGGDPNLEMQVQQQRKELMRQELDMGSLPK